MKWASNDKKLLLLVRKMAWCSEHSVWTVIRRRFRDVLTFVIDIHRVGGWWLSPFTELLPTGPLEQGLDETRTSGHSRSQALYVRISKKLRLTAPL